MTVGLLLITMLLPAQEGKTSMMRTYMQGLYDSKAFTIDAVKSEADWKTWRTRTMRNLREALGLERMPARTPLKPRIVGTLKRDGYFVDNLVFETRPGFLMTASLYRPAEVAGRVPAVLCVHGHTKLGKTSGAMQIRSINYARAGWVALAVDATGHGERGHIGHRRTWSIGAAGLTVEGVQVWDNMRAIDYLLSRPDVDAKRIGITGCSGGGNQTMYTAAMDDRIAVAVPVCSVSSLRGQIFTPNGIGCQCECIPDVYRYALENAVVCALIAPRPLRVLSGTEDRCFPVVHTQVSMKRLKRFYEAIDLTDRYKYTERPVPHGYPKALRELSHAWFDRWFNGRAKERTWREPETKVEPKSTLWCFPHGRLPVDSATLGSLAHEAGLKLAAGFATPKTAAERTGLRRRIRDEVLGGFPKRVALAARIADPVVRETIIHERVTLTSEPGVTIQLKITRPGAGGKAAPCVVRVHTKPTHVRWAHTSALLARGCAVVELDCRPVNDEHVSRAALVLGRPMVGMVAYDVTRAMDYLATRKDLDVGRVVLWADGLATLPGLYAAALDERIGGAVLSGLLSTYISPEPIRHPSWTFARGLLARADVAHLSALVAPRPLVIANPVGPDLKTLAGAGLKNAFAATREAYGDGKLRILAGEDAAILKATPRL